MKHIIVSIMLIMSSASAWAAPGDVTPTAKAFTGFSSASGKIKPTAFSDTLKFTGNVSTNPATKTINIPLQTAITGNAATATALAANGTNCSAGQAALGVDASGNAEGCWTPAGAYTLPAATSSVLGGVKPDGTSIINTAGAISVTTTSVGAVPTSRTVAGHALTSNVVISASDLTTGTLPHAQLPVLLSGDIPNNSANTSGNAATATALSANGTNCSAGQAALGVDASGNAEGCWTPTTYTAATAWTPTGAGVTLTVNSAHYSVVNGNQVNLQFDVTWPTTSDTGLASINGLPFTQASYAVQSGTIGYSEYSTVLYVYIANASPSLTLTTPGAGYPTNANLSGKRVAGQITYYK